MDSWLGVPKKANKAWGFINYKMGECDKFVVSYIEGIIYGT